MKNQKSFLVSGATGYIGSQLVQALAEEESVSVLILPVRNRRKAVEMYSDLVREGKLQITEMSVEDPLIQEISQPVDYIIHCAAATQSAEMIVHPVETADGIVLGTKNMLELARRKKIKSMVYLSSMEAYGEAEDLGRPQWENELGAICLDSVRSCYPLGKRMAEHYCHIYQQEYGIPVKIARLAQTFGRGVRLDDNRVYMQFARAAFEGNDIILKTQGQSMGNYCAIDDVISAIFDILVKGADGETYNVVNEACTMRIREMAELVADKIAGGRIAVQIEAGGSVQTGYAPDTALRMSGEKLRSLGWRATKGLVEMYSEIIEELARNGCRQSKICSKKR